MWRITLIVNALILFGFWLTGAIAISPAFNRFVLYTDGKPVFQLPLLTATVCEIRFSSIIMPVIWLIVSLCFMIWLDGKNETDRTKWVQLHTSVSIFCGLIILIVFSLAGVLPFLLIGALIE